MDRTKDAEGSFFATSLSSQENIRANLQPSTSSSADEKVNSKHQEQTADKESGRTVLHGDSGIPILEQNVLAFSENSDESKSSKEDVETDSSGKDSVPASHKLDIFGNDLHHYPIQTENRNSNNATAASQIDNSCAVSSLIKGSEARPPLLTIEVNHRQVEVGTPSIRTTGSADSPDIGRQINVNRGLVDTAAPFESVKEAVSKFGGIVDWKAHKALAIERHKHVELELEKVQEEIPEYRKRSEAAEDAKVQILKELDCTKCLVEELKLSLERAQTEKAQAKQDSELAQLRVKEMEQGITDDASVAAKAQLDVAKARHEAAVKELKSVKDELNALKKEYVHLVDERDMAIREAEEAVNASKEAEKTVEDLTLELMTTKQSLELAHAAHLEAEEQIIGVALAIEQDSVEWEKVLKQAEGELQQLNEQALVASDIKFKLDVASTLLSNLKAELAAYMEAKLNQESGSPEERKLTDVTEETKMSLTSMQASLASTMKELEEVKINIEKAKEEVNYLRVAASSLKSELDSEKEELTTIKQREAMASVAVSSLEAELNKMEVELILTKGKEAREKPEELPKVLQQAAQEADQAKSVVNLACEELRKAKEEAEQAKASASTMDMRLQAALKEIEAAKASERLAIAAVKALEESEQAGHIEGDDSPHRVTLLLEEYYILSKRAHEAEELANERVTAAVEQIKLAKKSETRCLEKLGDAIRKLDEKKEALRTAMEKAEVASEGKLGAAQELGNWRAEHEQQQKASDAAQGMGNSLRSPPRCSAAGTEARSITEDRASAFFQSMPNPKLYKSVSDREGTMPESTKMKKSFFPRIVMFLARKKAQSLK